MIRLQWLAHARALHAPTLRPRPALLSSPVACRNAHNTSRPADRAAMLKALGADSSEFRELSKAPAAPRALRRAEAPSTAASSAGPRARRFLPDEYFLQREEKRQIRKSSDTLTISGLGPNLRASDFYRIGPQDLSSWNDIVNEVYEERDPWTLDPTGTYRVSFESRAAADLFLARLNRLHELARRKLHARSPLWTATLPPQLIGSAGRRESGTETTTTTSDAISADILAELRAFTLLPGSGPAPTVVAGRALGPWPWQKLVQDVADESGFDIDPALVLVHLDHFTLNATELSAHIADDGRQRGQPWDVSAPYHLTATLKKYQRAFPGSPRRPLASDVAWKDKLDRRFLLVAKGREEALRFTRAWNQRTVTTDINDNKTLHTVVKASYVEH